MRVNLVVVRGIASELRFTLLSEISIVIPCWNEEQVLDQLLDSLCDVAASTDSRFQIVFVDDGSTDATWTWIEETQSRLARQDHPSLAVEGIRLPLHSGKSVAQAVGLSRSIDSEIIVFMDADGQHPPVALTHLIAVVRNTGGPAIATRVGYSRSAMSALGVKGLHLLMRLLGTQFDPALSEFLAIPREVALSMRRSTQLGIAPIVPLVQAVTLHVTVVEVEVRPRVSGDETSRWSPVELWRKALLQLLADPWRMLPRITLVAVACFLVLGLMASLAAVLAMYQGTSPGTVAILGSIVVLAGINVGTWVASVVISVMTLRLIDRVDLRTARTEEWNP